jgi:hypothetical protein
MSGGNKKITVMLADHDAFHRDVLEQIHLAVDELHEKVHGKRLGEAEDGSGVLYSGARVDEADDALRRIHALMSLTYDLPLTKKGVGEIFGKIRGKSVLSMISAATAYRMIKLDGLNQSEACRIVADAAGYAVKPAGRNKGDSNRNDGDAVRRAIKKLSPEDRAEALSEKYAPLFTLENIKRYRRKL